LTPINRSSPKDWKDLQCQVKNILEECGLDAEVDKEIRTVRGNVKVDDYAVDSNSKPPIIYLCECKHWQSAVPKSAVRDFRTVVGDYGANWGFIISSAGFQSGAFEAAAKTNVRLLTWDEFQELFVGRWIENYMVPRLRKEVDALVEYTEPINSRIFRKADQLDEPSRRRFLQLRKDYAELAFLAAVFYGLELFAPTELKPRALDLPMRRALQGKRELSKTTIPGEILDATCLRDFVDLICKYAREGIAEFDQLFGGRA